MLVELEKTYWEMEKLKEKLIDVRSLPDSSRRLYTFISNHPAAKLIIRTLGAFLVGFVLSAAAISGHQMPFAICLVAGLGFSLPAFFAFFGAGSGYVLFWGFSGALEPIAVGMLILAVACIFHDLISHGNRWFLPASTTLLSALIGVLFLIDTGFSLPGVLHFLVQTALTGAGCAAVRAAREGKSRISLCVCGFFILSGFAPILLFGVISVGEILAVLFSFAALGSPYALTTAIVAGLAIDLSLAPPQSITAILCGVGLVCGFLRLPNKLYCFAPYLACVVIGILLSGGTDAAFLLAATMGCGFGLMMPDAMFSQAGHDDARLLQNQLRDAALVLDRIHLLLDPGERTKHEPGLSVIFDRAADRVCRCCVMRGTCWEHGAAETYRALRIAAKPILARGGALESDFPASFSGRCRHLDGFTTAVNQELDVLTYRRQCHSRLSESKAIVQAQYHYISAFLRQVSSIRQRKPIKSQFQPDFGYRAQGGRGNSISGDRGACFQLGADYYIILCDGMGTGAEAAAESRGAVELLSELIRAGMEPESSLEMLNGLYILRDDGAFSTVDLLQISLLTGEGTLYKWGAAPSYLKRGKEVRKIGTASPPPGFGVGSMQQAEQVRLSLQGGEMLVLVSDGAVGEEAEQFIKAYHRTSTKELASGILGCQKPEGEDDRTAAVLRLRAVAAL